MTRRDHIISSIQPMIVERDWIYGENGLDIHEATVTDPAGDEEFRCECGEEFDSRGEAEAHIREVMPE